MGGSFIQLKCFLTASALFWSTFAFGQLGTSIAGRVLSVDGDPIEGVTVRWLSSNTSAEGDAERALPPYPLTISDGDGSFKILIIDAAEGVFHGNLQFSAIGYVSKDLILDGPHEAPLELRLQSSTVQLNEARITDENFGQLEWMPSLRDGAIYCGIKSTVIRPSENLILPGEVNARNIFAGLPGANIWESDAAGLQLGVGVRGLSPNRSSHLSMRQNGVPIAADPLGYPESYYTPPLGAVESVQHVAGASALQYGSQLGGMLNFIMKSAELESPREMEFLISGTGYSRNEGDSQVHQHWHLSHSQGHKKSSHYILLDHKSGEGWRRNSGFKSTTAFIAWKQKWSGRLGTLTFKENATIMRREEQQPGGLTDAQFASNPRLSLRERNWFRVDWNIASLAIKWQPKQSEWTLHGKFYGLLAARKSLGFLGTPNRVDPMESRNLIWGDFLSAGWDFRATRRWTVDKGDRWHALVMGSQGLIGENSMRQGDGTSGDGPDFWFLNPDNLEGSSYLMPNRQISGFVQGIISLSKQLFLTPGVRWDWIHSEANGQYREVIFDGAGTLLEDSVFTSSASRARHVVLPGLGCSWRPSPGFEIYANAVANYRAINFSDIQLKDLGVIIDPNIRDERGSNFDIGCRASSRRMAWDFSAFALFYRDRIGLISSTVSDPVLVERPVLLRANLANARTVGFEGSVRGVLWSRNGGHQKLSGRGTASWMKGVYLEGGMASTSGKNVEFVPAYTMRGDLSYHHGDWSAQCQVQAVGMQFTEATNSEYSANGMHGLIPAYSTVDLSFGRKLSGEGLHIGFKVSNLLDTMYFTRRALAYPGPGILSSDGRNFRLSVTFRPNFHKSIP